MCGIAGKVSVSGRVDAAAVEGICETQAHRGPDSRGLHEAPGAVIGIQRLRVIDLETGDQPIRNENGTAAVVLNGEIYNYAELREELLGRGHRLSSRGDAEPIVHLHEELGSDCVDRLDGMFAFAVWDDERRRLTLACDRVGKKPIHYHLAPDGTLTFASELAALMSDRSIPRELDPSSLDCYLAYGWVQAPHTIYRDVFKLPPAHRLVWEDGRVTIERYWQLDHTARVDGDPAELAGELRSLISAAVKKRLVADVPLGAFLSGGIDSSVVVSEMALHSPKPVRTFSIGSDHEAYDELPRARLVAEHFGTEHTEHVVKPDAIGLLPELVRHYGEPFADSSAIPSFHLAELTRRDVTVALNGDGGDESFAGYLRHIADSKTAWLDRVPVGARRALAGTAARIRAGEGRSGAAYARRMIEAAPLPAPERYALHLGILGAEERSALLAPAVAGEVDAARTSAVVGEPWAEANGASELDHLLAVDVAAYLPGDLLPKIDIATMAHSLEARSPLLDPTVMQFAASLPPRMKLRGRRGKWILRRAYEDVLPAEVISGPKRGFSVPLGSWFRADLRARVENEMLDPGFGGGWLQGDAVGAIVSEHMSGRADNSARIWSLLFLEEWRRGAGL